MLHRVPPSPDVIAGLFLRYQREKKKLRITFKQFLDAIGYSNHADDVEGLDDFAGAARLGAGGLQRIDIPQVRVEGELSVKVLLVDFPDKPGRIPAEHFEDMLFSDAQHPTGSMRDYYKEISRDKVNVTGTVHGWLRLPQPYSFYTNSASGMNPRSYPRNAQRMAEDAVRAARAEGVPFEPELDKLGQGVVTALFIVHAGRGAEELHPSIAGNEIWSHKWNLRTPVEVAPNLFASIYLTVPEDCRVGVCAHELGHLAFQWQDFYDPNYDEDGKHWAGSGVWDLMAGGSWNGRGVQPAHPAALHKAQHGWLEVQRITSGTTKVTLPPYSDKNASAIRIESKAYKKSQYLLLENRRRDGFDGALPGEGLLVWRVDESGEMEAPNRPGLLLVQADGRRELESNWNQGDAADPFPGTKRRRSLGDTGAVSTSFNGRSSGVRLEDIEQRADGAVSLTVTFK